MSNYETDWRDTLRHFANFGFIGSYVCLERGYLVAGALFTIASELALAPSALKHKSWSTLLVGGVFLALALGTLTRALLL